MECWVPGQVLLWTIPPLGWTELGWDSWEFQILSGLFSQTNLDSF